MFDILVGNGEVASKGGSQARGRPGATRPPPSGGGGTCAATSDFVATWIFHKWGQTGTNVVWCSLKMPPSNLSPVTR